jgi:hypothetical protein
MGEGVDLIIEKYVFFDGEFQLEINRKKPYSSGDHGLGGSFFVFNHDNFEYQLRNYGELVSKLADLRSIGESEVQSRLELIWPDLTNN